MGNPWRVRVLLLCVVADMACMANEQRHHDFHARVFDIAMDTESQFMYVGGDNIVYKLAPNLTVVRNVSLISPCHESPCNHQVRVLQVDNSLQRLLACVTDGQCWLLGLQDLNKQSLTSSESGKFLSADIRAPLVRQIAPTKGNASLWMVASANNPILSVKEISQYSGTYFRWASGGRGAFLSKHSPSVFQFVDGFCSNKECFYLTLQQSSASSPELVSRVASVCAGSVFPYVERRFEGRVMDSERRRLGKTIYNRLLAFSLSEIGSNENVDRFLVMVFEKSSTASNGSGVHGQRLVVGALRLSEIEKKMKATWELCSPNNNNVHEPNWYKERDVGCNVATELSDRCPEDEIRFPVIQFDESPIKIDLATPIDVDDDTGNVTSVFTHTPRLNNATRRLDDRMIIYIVMTTGRIFKFYATVSTFGRTALDIKQLSPSLTDDSNEDDGDSDDDKIHTGEPARGVAMTEKHFYLLSGTKVVRRPLDPCLSIDNCEDCNNIEPAQSCVWCHDQSLCQLVGKCPEQGCPLKIKEITPTSGPVNGGTTLTLKGSYGGRVIADDISITVCQKYCRNVTSHGTREVALQCQVPESVNHKQQACPVTTLSSDPFLNGKKAPVTFNYTVPAVFSFAPARILGSVPSRLTFTGSHLDTGSDVTVFTGDYAYRCDVIKKTHSELQCEIPAHPGPTLSSPLCFNLTLVIDQYFLLWEKSPAPSPQRQSPSTAMDPNPSTLDGNPQTLGQSWLSTQDKISGGDPSPQLSSVRSLSGLDRNALTLICRFPNPEILSVNSNWTFVGGGVEVKVTGRYLDLATVHIILTVNGSQSDEGNTTLCTDVRNGMYLVCRTPNVTALTSASLPTTADMSFTMSGRQSTEKVNSTNTNGPFTVHVLPEPTFQMTGNQSAHDTCRAVAQDSQLKITVSSSTPGMPYAVIVEGQRCAKGSFTSTTTSLQCHVQSVWSHLLGTSSSTTGSHSSIVTTWNVQVHIKGRRFHVGCVTPQPKSGTEGLDVLIVVVGVVCGVVLLALLVLSLGCYVCHRKRVFQKKRHGNRSSVVSAGTLLRSESGGSAEARCMSLDRLLNPDNDPVKQREIEVSGIVIQRQRLDLGEMVGHGNFGCVYEGVYHTGENEEQKVAVKTQIDSTIHIIDLKTFIDEAMLMKNFQHPHVLGLLGLSDGDRGPLVVLPFMERGDILSYVKDESKELTVGDILQFSLDITNGMGYLASSKFVHRDLAARNCMLDEELRVKVADFGLCRDVYEKGYYHSDNRKRLPIRWMAPESIEKGTYTSKSDVWSMGVVLWEMMTRGVTPYPGVEGWDILRYLLTGRRLNQPFMCPDAVYALMERCWRADPLERPIFREIERDLRKLTSALQEPAAPNAIHVHTPITFPDCHRFKGDDVIMAIIQAMNSSSYSPEFSPSTLTDSGGQAALAAAAIAALSPPGSKEGFPSKPGVSGVEMTDQGIISIQKPCAATELSTPTAVAETEDVNQLSLEVGPQVNLPNPLPEIRDDGYFLLEKDDLDTSTRPQLRGQDSTLGPTEPNLPTAAQPLLTTGTRGGGENSADPVVTWRRVAEMKTQNGKDDGYFELEREKSVRL